MTWSADDPVGNEAGKVRFDIVPYFGNSNLDLGCGPHKVWQNFVGVDNGKETDLFGIAMKPDLVVGTCERLSLFASGVIDCVFSSHLLEHIEDYKSALSEWWRLVKPGGHLVLYLPHADLYPNIGQPGANKDHKHDFRNEDIVAAMREVATGWDLVVNEKRDQLREYSFLQVYRKLPEAQAGERLESWTLPKPGKTVGIVRPGAYGDAMWGGALARAFKRQGYRVTVYTGPVGREVLRADPHVDQIITMPNGLLDDNELLLYMLWESRKYAKWVNLIGVVEGRMLPHPNEIQYYWPQQIRHAHFNRNYHEAMFEMAGLELDLHQQFYPDVEERAWAREQRGKLFGDGKMVMLAPSGSGGPKTWPHVEKFMHLMAAAGVYTVVVGEPRVEVDPPEKFSCLLGKDLPIRLVMALALEADCVIGEETAVLNAVASTEVPKVVLLSHSSAENLTKHWTNTVSIEPTNIGCHPCHRLHHNFEFCTKDKVTGWSACQAAISAEKVAAVVFRALGGKLQEAA
jgi:ADP-heptose:LPS heptosyltransferase/predicted SAM-dependent methyltransferase